MFDYRTGALEETFVLRFGSEYSRINAYTLASSLVAIADAAKAANAQINPGFDIEIVVESLEPGSFKAKIKAVYRSSGNLFSASNIHAVVLGVIGNFVYQHTLAPDPNVQINVNVTNESVVIETAGKQVVIPRAVYDGCRQAERSEVFTEGVKKIFHSIEKDQQIQYLEILSSRNPQESPIAVSRDQFSTLAAGMLPIEGDSREIIEITELQIIRAILERGSRLWQFSWRGVRIAAPVTDSKFYDDFFERRIAIAPGDELQVKLRIVQQRDPDTGIFTNSEYEVREVLRHIPRMQQTIINTK